VLNNNEKIEAGNVHKKGRDEGKKRFIGVG